MTADRAPEASERIRYDEENIPLYVRCGRLSDYPARWGSCHWHQDLEFIHIMQGEMRHFVSGERVLLREGDSLLVNAGQLHYCYTKDMQDCVFLCILAPPSLLTANEELARRFIRPMTTDFSFSCAVYQKGTEEGDRYAELLREIWRLKQEKDWGYQMNILGLLLPLVMMAARRHEDHNLERQTQEDPRLIAQKRMIVYIKENYTQDITAQDIARSAQISEALCGRLFKSYLGQTPMQYLNAYRLESSRRILLNTEQKITDIAAQCGFHHISYYGKLFERAYGLSPLVYRKNNREEKRSV